MRRGWLILLVAAVLGCGRYFPGPIRPLPGGEQRPHIVVHDDGTVSYDFERLEISLRPLTDAELNRTYASVSKGGATSTNPYTYGDWTAMGEEWSPQRFTVFLLKIKNYAYPKVQVDPARITLTSESKRKYAPLTFLEFSEYYRAHALAWAGNNHARLRQREELLRRTLYQETMVFSGQEIEGYVAFPALPPDVDRMTLALADVAIRFNYADEPVETVDIEYRFERVVAHGYHPPETATAAQ